MAAAAESNRWPLIRMADLHTDEFDWDAFMRDTLELSVDATGAWLRCLYKMRYAPIRGRLSLPVSGFAQLFGKTPKQARKLIDEIVFHKVGNSVNEHVLDEESDLVQQHVTPTLNGRVTRRNVLSQNSNADDNAIVTLENRRMYRAWKKRNGNKIRQLRFRKNRTDPERNAKVTPALNGRVTFRNKTQKPQKTAENGSSHIGPRARVRVREEFKEIREEEEQKSKPLHRVTPTRIPDPFPITPEMWAWLAENIPDLENPNGRHHDWVEHWTNATGPKAEKMNWFLTWQKGMRLARKWQEEDKNGTNKQNNSGGKPTSTDRLGEYGSIIDQYPTEAELRNRS